MMRLSYLSLATLFLLPLSIFQGTPAQSRSNQTTQWEYRIEANCSTHKANQELLNQLGHEGWELVSVAPYGSEGGCSQFTFKRLRSKNNPYVAPTPTPAPSKPAPLCTLTLEQAPTVHGLRLGLTVSEVIAILPGYKTMIEYRLKQPTSRQSLAMHRIQVQIPDLRFAETEEQKALARQMAPLSYITMEFYEGKVARLAFQYASYTDVLQWDSQTWTQKLAESFGLPNFESWRKDGNGQAVLICTGFEASTSLYQPSFTLTDTIAFAKAKDWLAAENIRLRREYKP